MNRKIFIEDLPKFQSGINIGRIDWNKSVGYKIGFIYENISGIIDIISYKYPNITISYNDNIKDFHISQFRKCQLGSFLNIYSKKYLFNVGEIVNNKKVIKQIRVKQGNNTSKGYKYICLADNYIGKATEVSFKNMKCPVCTNAITMKGINDIATTNTEMIEYFVDTNDAFKYTKSSGKAIKMHCLECGNEKMLNINTLYGSGFSCNKCGDGFSYPNKFMFNILDQLNINFESEYSPDWISPKRYDFYLINHKFIIEMDGAFHSNDNKMNGQTKEESEGIDNYKEKIANNYNINVIRIDSKISDLEYIKNKILDSRLSMIFDLSNINWIQCHEFALSNRVKEACELWNNGKTTIEISKYMKIANGTIVRYLTNGKMLNWCNYDKTWYYEETAKRTKELRSKKVEIFKDGNSLGVFNSGAELERKSIDMFGVKLASCKISMVCNSKRNSHKGYTFKYIDNNTEVA